MDMSTSTLENDMIWLVDLAYWKSNEKPDTCKGYRTLDKSKESCIEMAEKGQPCEHFNFCRRKDVILGKVIEKEEMREKAEKSLKSEEMSRMIESGNAEPPPSGV